jgi:Tfp pilus assembly protein PilP
MQKRNILRATLALSAFLLLAGPLAAQAPAPAAGAAAGAGTAAKKPAAPVPEPKLTFDREVFSYQPERRRDPFTKLRASSGGPRFDDLVLRGIIYSGDQSLVVLFDAPNKRTYKVHRGQIVGNAKVVQIDPTRVTFTVENFGQSTTEMLELKRKTGGAS